MKPVKQTRIDALNERGGSALNIHLEKEATNAMAKLLEHGKLGQTKTELVTRLLLRAAARV